jgi:hypothetical protein
MSFSLACHAWEAAEVLLQFRPCSLGMNGMYGMHRAAAFLVTAECGGSAAPDVRAWSIAWDDRLEPLLRISHKVLAASLHNDVTKQFKSHDLIRITQLPMAVTAAAAPTAVTDAAPAPAAAPPAAAAPAADTNAEETNTEEFEPDNDDDEEPKIYEHLHGGDFFDIMHVVSALDKKFGEQFTKVLCKAAREHGVTVGCIQCAFLKKSDDNLPVWVVKW